MDSVLKGRMQGDHARKNIIKTISELRMVCSLACHT
jgi:hypothetical protein